MSRDLEMPFINVRDLVLFPQMTQGLYIGRQQTINAIQYALTKGNKKILVLTQKQSQNNTPKGLRDMYSVGTICSVEGSVLFQDGTMKAVLTGESTFDVSKIFENEGIQLVRGKMRKESKQTKAIEKLEKLQLLELLVRAKPFAAIDEDAVWFEKLKSEKKASEFTKTLQTVLNYPGLNGKQSSKKIKTTFSKKNQILVVNSKIKMQQRLLEENNSERKMELLKNYLKFEIKATVGHF